MESSAQSKIKPVLPELGGLFHRRLDAIDRGKDIITSKKQIGSRGNRYGKGASSDPYDEPHPESSYAVQKQD